MSRKFFYDDEHDFVRVAGSILDVVEHEGIARKVSNCINLIFKGAEGMRLSHLSKASRILRPKQRARRWPTNEILTFAAIRLRILARGRTDEPFRRVFLILTIA